MAAETHKRIAKNTLMLYTRQILTIGISLYTVRLTLEVLGLEDFGLYTVVGGVVALLAFMTGSMSAATQRFFSFALGQGDSELLKRTFSATCIVYLSIALLALLLLETVGLWFMQNGLRVPVERVAAVSWVYQFAVLSFAATIVRAPFGAIFVAHEDMQYVAYLGVAESILKLVSVITLMHLPYDKLISYSAFLFGVALLQMVVSVSICLIKYRECQFRKLYWDKKLVREIFGFTGWTLFGQITTIGRGQGITILLNQFFNPAVVGAKAIASSVRVQVNMFAANFNLGLYPPIIKSYAEGDRKEMFSLMTNGSKVTFFLLWIFAFPLFLEMETVLRLWLGEVPPHVVLFTRLGLIDSLFLAIGNPIATAARAPGKMKGYELTLGAIQVSIFFVAWIVLKAGAPAYSVYLISIVANLIMLFVRLALVKRLVELPVLPFIRQCFMPVVRVSILSVMLSLPVYYYMPEGIFYSGIIVACSVLFSCVSMYYLGMDQALRCKLRMMIVSRVQILLKRTVV